MAAGTRPISGSPEIGILKSQVGNSRLARDIARAKRSYTGEFLKPVLARGNKGRKKGQVAAE